MLRGSLRAISYVAGMSDSSDGCPVALRLQSPGRHSFLWDGSRRLERYAGRPDVQAFVPEATAGMISF